LNKITKKLPEICLKIKKINSDNENKLHQNTDQRKTNKQEAS